MSLFLRFLVLPPQSPSSSALGVLMSIQYLTDLSASVALLVVVVSPVQVFPSTGWLSPVLTTSDAQMILRLSLECSLEVIANRLSRTS